MKTIRGLSFKKILSNPKTSYVFTTEIKKLFYALTIFILGICVFQFTNAFSFDSFLELPIYEIVLFSVLFLVLFRLFLNFFISKKTLSLYAVFFFDAFAVYLRFAKHLFLGENFSDRILFLCLTVLSLVSLQEILIEKGTGAFPFHFFFLLAVLIFVLPVKQTPIDWSPVLHMMEAASEGAQNTFYSLGGIFHSKSYNTGYSSFFVTGEKISFSNKQQLILTTSDTPYHVFTDKDTGKQKIVKKTLYLTGAHNADARKIIDFISLLHANEIDKDTATLFSNFSEMDIEYVYLKTEDKIAPDNSALIRENSETTLHKKGDALHSIYLDIDYGSPYLTALFDSENEVSPLSYEEACDYLKELYRVDLSLFLSEEKYNDILRSSATEKKDLDTIGTTKQMKDLADEITKDCANDYEKCEAIETYLRQFPYTTDAVGGYQKDSTMATAAGMADIANRFLFETKEGYCVHYTSSMVTLLRLSGIPARAVMGYRYDFPAGKQMEYCVPGSCAHTWPEAYVKNVGWVPFEPTGAFPSAALRSWRKTPEGEPNLLPAYEKNVTEEGTDSNDSVFIAKKRIKMAKVIGILIGSVVALILFVFFFTIILKSLCYRFAAPEKRIKMDVERTKKYLLKKHEDCLVDRGLLCDYLTVAPEKLQPELKKAFSMYYQMLYDSTSKNSFTYDDSSFTHYVLQNIKKAG